MMASLTGLDARGHGGVHDLYPHASPFGPNVLTRSHLAPKCVGCTRGGQNRRRRSGDAPRPGIHAPATGWVLWDGPGVIPGAVLPPSRPCVRFWTRGAAGTTVPSHTGSPGFLPATRALRSRCAGKCAEPVSPCGLCTTGASGGRGGNPLANGQHSGWGGHGQVATSLGQDRRFHPGVTRVASAMRLVPTVAMRTGGSHGIAIDWVGTRLTRFPRSFGIGAGTLYLVRVG